MKFGLGEGPDGRGWWAVGSGFPWSVLPGRAAAGRPSPQVPASGSGGAGGPGTVPAEMDALLWGCLGSPPPGLQQGPAPRPASGPGALKPSRSSANPALGDFRRTFSVAAVTMKLAVRVSPWVQLISLQRRAETSRARSR